VVHLTQLKDVVPQSDGDSDGDWNKDHSSSDETIIYEDDENKKV
jgi:hypothetical protein